MKFKNYIYFEERDDLRAGEANIKATKGGKVKEKIILLFLFLIEIFFCNRLFSIRMVLIKV